jgi:hypothetical protein
MPEGSLGKLRRLRLGKGSRREDADYVVDSPADFAERARAAIAAHEARVSGQVATRGRQGGESADAQADAEERLVSLIEAAVEDGLRRLHEESERLLSEIETRLAASERQAELASLHLGELQARIKRLAGK